MTIAAKYGRIVRIFSLASGLLNNKIKKRGRGIYFKKPINAIPLSIDQKILKKKNKIINETEIEVKLIRICNFWARINS